MGDIQQAYVRVDAERRFLAENDVVNNLDKLVATQQVAAANRLLDCTPEVPVNVVGTPLLR